LASIHKALLSFLQEFSARMDIKPNSKISPKSSNLSNKTKQLPFIQARLEKGAKTYIELTERLSNQMFNTDPIKTLFGLNIELISKLTDIELHINQPTKMNFSQEFSSNKKSKSTSTTKFSISETKTTEAKEQSNDVRYVGFMECKVEVSEEKVSEVINGENNSSVISLADDETFMVIQDGNGYSTFFQGKEFFSERVERCKLVPDYLTFRPIL
jgi:hypothetical protein